jgi:hypothetical protein
MTDIFIQRVKTAKEEKLFFDLPWSLYKSDSSWVPPLKLSLKEMYSKKHPFFQHADITYWLAYKENEIVGRIAAIINPRHNEYHDENCGFFGLFETIDDLNVSKKLFETVEQFFEKRGMDKIRGPVNPSTNYECGTLVSAPENDPPQLMMTYNPKYHLDHFSTHKFCKSMDLFAYKIPINFQMPEKIIRIGKRIEERSKITFRNIDLKNWQQEIEYIHDIYNSSWEKNWGFIPMDREEFMHMGQEMKNIIEPSMVFLAFDGENPIGVIVTVPDFNQVFKEIPSGKLLPLGIFKLLRHKKYIKRARTIIMGVKSNYRKRGLESILYYKSQQAIIKNGLHEVEMSWILENNENMIRPLELMGAEKYKTYRIFEKEIQHP